MTYEMAVGSIGNIDSHHHTACTITIPNKYVYEGPIDIFGTVDETILRSR